MKEIAYAIILFIDFDVRSFASSFFRVHGSGEHRTPPHQISINIQFVIYMIRSIFQLVSYI